MTRSSWLSERRSAAHPCRAIPLHRAARDAVTRLRSRECRGGAPPPPGAGALGQPTLGRHLHQLEAIRAGAGLGILPCFVGDADPSLSRLTPPIEGVEAHYWLLVHPDLKAVPRVRQVMERIRGAFKASRAALRG